MSSEVKPREYWYYNYGLNDSEPDLAYRGECIHLVEHSAYLALEQKCRELEAKNARFKELNEMDACEVNRRDLNNLRERVKELEGKLNTDTICPVCCEGYQGADKIGVQELKDANYKYYNESKTLKAQNKILRDAVEHTNEFCLCERFKTMGFDYNEDHKNKGRAKMGGRWLTPRDVAKSALAAINKGEK